MVKCLELEGVHTLFGYPGAAICPFYDALAGSSLHHVLVRTEQNAAHAASGYARVSGRVGVCVATSGPGATNLLTGIASAYMDSIPLVVITGQVRSDLLGRDVFQEADITGAAEPFTKHSYIVKKAADLPRVFKEAFHIASTGRPGPVLIDVPIDMQQKMIGEFDYSRPVDIIGYKPRTQGHSLQIRKAAEALAACKRPVLCAGGGVFSAGAEQALRAFVEQVNLPTVSTMMGIGALPTAHPLNLGMLGSHGGAPANKAVRDADLVIMAGARVGDRAVAAPGQIATRAKVIHIDIDPAEIGKNLPVHIPIVGDLRQVLTELTRRTEGVQAPDEWVRAVVDRRQRYAAKPIPQMSLMELATIRQEDLGVKIVVMRNTRLGMVRELQDNQYGGVHSGIDLTASPDFVKIAEAYGIRASAVSSNEEAAAALDEMLTDDRPYLLECRVMPDYPSL